MSYHYIDMSSYPRREHFEYFRNMANPYLGVTVNVDVTELVSACREKKISFYLAFMHASAIAADRVPELRRRIRGDAIVEYDMCPTSHTELLDDGTYCYCDLNHNTPFSQYITYAENQREFCRARGTISEDSDSVEKFYFVSCLPWLYYTDLTQPTSGGDESNPRITWGKYSENLKGRLDMPLTLNVHHGLVDGVHISKFYENILAEINLLADEIRHM